MSAVHLPWARVRKVALWAVAVLLVLSLALAVAAVWAVRRAFPQQDGALRLPGLTSPVTVHRDGHGIPQVYAKTSDDLFRAQGYLHAQDRFWEMDFRRHVTGGRLAELFGESQVETDSYLRTMGWRRVAEQEWQLLSPDARRHLQVYADGVNAWLADHDGGRASLEYTVLGLQNSGYTIEQWSPVDSLAWLKAMAWDLRGNMDTEIARAALLAAGLTRPQVEQLYPAYPYDRNSPIVDGGAVVGGVFDQDAGPVPSGAPTAPTSGGGQGGGGPDEAGTGGGGTVAARTVTELAEGLSRLPVMLGDGGSGIGSNSWVIGGRLTATGKPILANDPHLSPSMPGIWYQMGLHCECAFDVAGFTFAGVPGVVIGHNARIAWGFTNLDPDVTDLYLERVDGDRVQVDGEWLPLQTRTETIEVAGGKPVSITVRTSRHGPLLSDASASLRDIGRRPPVDPAGSPAGVAASPQLVPGRPAPDSGTRGDGYAIALSWTALRPGRTAEALFALNTAANWTEFRAAAALFEVPAQNIVYADVAGNIGYQSPGRIPVRGKGDGRWMSPGWDSAYDWKGFIPFAELPSVLNPPGGYLVTANQAVVGPGYPRLLTSDWSYGYRSQRIRDMITSAPGAISVADVQRTQFDNRNGFAPTLVPAVVDALGAATDPSDDARVTATGLWKDWDFQQPADGPSGSADARRSAAAAYYNATWRHLLAGIFDELPASYRPDGGDRWFEVVRGLLAQPGSPWWDRQDTPAVERRDDILRSAAAEAAAELRRDQGDRPADWRWGRMHILTARNQTFGSSGVGPVEWLFNADPVGVSGGDAIVNATGWDAAAGYEVDAVPSMRMIVDLADLDASRWIQLTGNSGHAFHRNYDDQLPLWRAGQTLPMRWDRAAVTDAATQTLTLRP
ncbi:penicillin acylase family protein [Micromonospora sp. WMMD980]|uniref:penicillin acylase family protein n=1 Tax=Micromonospora sp. WMMD980 TaxID=3016088 RepID=UPI00241622A2|nr:penicillin acylase family protein [Micromonospora sp. WMMD980]MDG4799958.1 penicillin acylase family protein [Micromonospora sp. WMMD980]